MEWYNLKKTSPGEDKSDLQAFLLSASISTFNSRKNTLRIVDCSSASIA